MVKSPSSSAQQARDALAARLKEVMFRAGLDGVKVAAAAGWHPSKSSRILTATTLPGVADIEAWCRVCGVPEQADDLVATMFAVDEMYGQWKRRERGGLTRLQDSYRPLYERTKTFRTYSSDVVPGFLQTHAYARALFSTISRFRGVPNDSEQAATARVERSGIMRRPGRTFAFLLEEAVLYYRSADVATMIGQMEHLRAVMAYPQVSIGIIPLGADRRDIWAMETFTLFDGTRASSELLAAEVNVTAPSEIEDYVKAFASLSTLAVYGMEARVLIGRACESFT